MSEQRDITEIVFSPADQVIVLPTRNEINFVAWMAHEHFWSTDLNNYMQLAKKMHDAHELYRLGEAPDSSEMPIYLSPGKSALVRYGLESYLKKPPMQYPESVLVAESLAVLYPESYQSRLGKLTVTAASEAVDYGTIECQDLSVRASRLGISRNVLGEILLNHLVDMPMSEARSFSFNTADTDLRTVNGAVNGTKVLSESSLVHFIDGAPSTIQRDAFDITVTTALPPVDGPGKATRISPNRKDLDTLQDFHPTQPIDLDAIHERLQQTKSKQPVISFEDPSAVEIDNNPSDVLGLLSFKVPEPRRTLRDRWWRRY